MALSSRKEISLYEEAKAGFSSLIQQTATVFASFIVMLLVTGGAPSSFVVALSFCLGVTFVAWSEQTRVTNLDLESGNQHRSEAFTSLSESQLDLTSLIVEPKIPFEVANQLSLPLGAPDLTLIRLQPDATEDDLKIVINGAYKHVLGNHYLMSSERLKEAEFLLRNYRITVRKFVSILANSELYRRLFFYSSSQLRFIELNYKHLLGRAPYDQSEIIEHVNLYNSKGYEAEINSYIYSQEYSNHFGDWIVPYYRGFLSGRGARTVGFTRMFKLYRGYANSDQSQAFGNSSSLVSDLARNQASPIIVPGRSSLSGLSIEPGRIYRITITGVFRPGYPQVRRANTEYLVPYDKLASTMQRLQRQGGEIISIVPIQK